LERLISVPTFPHGLNPLQLKAVNSVLDAKSLLVAAPTSSGKTLIVELAATWAVAAVFAPAMLLNFFLQLY
jgi:helicase